MTDQTGYRLHYAEGLGAQLIIHELDDIEWVEIDAAGGSIVLVTSTMIHRTKVYGGNLDLNDLREENSVLVTRFTQIELAEYLEIKRRAIAVGEPIPRAPWPISQRRVPLIIIGEKDRAELNKTTYRTYRAATGR